MSNTQYCTHTGETTVCDACMGRAAKHDMTQAETDLRRELGKAEARCESWRELLRLEREHAAARLTEMTEAAAEANSSAIIERADRINAQVQLAAMTERAADLKRSSDFMEIELVEEHNLLVAQTIMAMDAERVSFEQEIERLKEALVGTVRYIEDMEQSYKAAFGDEYLEPAVLVQAQQALAGTKEGG